MKHPHEHLGFQVGEDRKLADWQQIRSYFKHLSESDRMLLQEYGLSTEGRPMIVAIVSAPENLNNLDKYRKIQARLADPRDLAESKAQELIDEGKSVVLITCSIHATEVGAAQMSMELAHELLTRTDDDVMEILDNVIFLFVPSLNPDGLDLVVNWYKETLGTKAEGTRPPELYQRYTGHDNNRDWFMLTQKENRNTVEKIHNVWHPHIVHDQHQMGSNGPRFVLPPFIDPYDPNVDPILRQEVAWLGQSMAAALTSKAKAGVATNIIYDAFSPSRAYQHYHGGVRILSEAASVNIASPIEVNEDEMVERRGFDAREASWNHPLVWQGGRWTLRDIVEYDKIVAFACLQHAAKYRKDWVANFYQIHKKAVQPKEKPYAFVVPKTQRDPQTAAEMLEVLKTGLVELETASEDFSAGGTNFNSGDIIIKMSQPYGGYAKTLLEKQEYPDLRLYSGGPPKRPYDITAHGLPLQMNVECVQIEQPFEAPTQLLDVIDSSIFDVPWELGDQPWLALRPESNQSYKIVNQRLNAGEEVVRLSAEYDGLPAGTFLIDDSKDNGDKIANLDTTISARLKYSPRIGLYKSSAPNADEGWTRFILENYNFKFTNISNNDIRNGNLSNLDVIILPSQNISLMESGLPTEYPELYAGGLDERCASNLREYVKKGGHLLAFDAACDFVIKHFWLPVENSVAQLKDEEFYVPGSFLRCLFDTNDSLTYGMDREASVLFLRSPAFKVKGNAKAIGQYPGSNILLSGWILGEQCLYHKANLVKVPLGSGEVVLYGMRPQFRAQTRGTYKLLFNAIFDSAISDNVISDNVIE